MPKHLISGSPFPALAVKNVHGQEVAVPDEKRWVHLQFRRFAACPICNIHLQTFIKRKDELDAAGVREVVVYHSKAERLLPFQGSYPFDVIADPKKELYRRCGVGTSPLAVVGAFRAMAQPNLPKQGPPTGLPEGGVFGLPADFLVSPDGVLVACHYGKDAFDQWTMDEMLVKVSSSQKGAS